MSIHTPVYCGLTKAQMAQLADKVGGGIDVMSRRYTVTHNTGYEGVERWVRNCPSCALS